MIRNFFQSQSETRRRTQDDGDPESAKDVPSEAATEETADDSTSAESLTKAEIFTETGLLPEEYVCQVLASHGGRLRQQEICEHAGWSESNNSRTLKKMEEEGLIIRFPLGREKIVFLPEEAPEIAPFPASDDRLGPASGHGAGKTEVESK